MTCFADVKIDILNDTDQKKIMTVKWLSHPWGCHSDYLGNVSCDFNKAVAELGPGNTYSLVLINEEAKNGQKWCIVWENYWSAPDFNSKTCFTITDEMKGASVTPTSIQVKTFTNTN